MILEKAVPPKLAKETKRIALVVDAEWLQWIVTWRKLQDVFPQPTLSDAIRTLVEKALKAEGIGPPAGYTPSPSSADDKPKPKKGRK